MEKEELDLILEDHRKWLNGEGGKKADLTACDLRTANLRGANLTGADLTAADLRAANLRGANLTAADLRAADLEGADLRGADLTTADLRESDLRGTDLIRANLRGADLRLSNLYRADLRGANLKDADLSQSNVNKCIGFYSIDNVGTFNGKITFHKESNQVWAGCWSGSLEDFKNECLKVIEKYPSHKDDLIMAISFFMRKSKETLKEEN